MQFSAVVFLVQKCADSLKFDIAQLFFVLQNVLCVRVCVMYLCFTMTDASGGDSEACTV